MSLFMTELHDFRSTGRHTIPAAAPMLNLMPYRTLETRSYDAPYDVTTPAERIYDYAAVQGYQTHQEQKCPSPPPSIQCAGDPPISAAGTIEPFHLNNFQLERARNAVEDSRRTYQLIDGRQHYLDSDSLHSSVYYLDNGFHALEQPRFTTTSAFETTQHDLYQIPYSESVTPPSGSPSPIISWSPPQENMGEASPACDDAIFRKEDLEEDDVGSDKPYARLIWEALMQAPGHRMMLREIYAWFQCNTNKARDSGSNGWQNSIRHNLSMNQVCTRHCSRQIFLWLQSLTACPGI